MNAKHEHASHESGTRSRAPGPPGFLGVRNVVRFSKNQLELLRELADRYGDVVEMKVLGKPWFLISHPDDIEAAVVKNARVMARDDYTDVLQRAASACSRATATCGSGSAG